MPKKNGDIPPPKPPKKTTPFEGCPKCGNPKQKMSICIICAVEKFEEKHKG